MYSFEQFKKDTLRHLRWFMTRHGMIVLSLILGAICSMVWYWVPDYTTHVIFYYMMWVFFALPIGATIFLIFNAGMNYLMEWLPSNKFFEKYRKFQMWINTPFNDYFKKKK
jgi:MFS family permease